MPHKITKSCVQNREWSILAQWSSMYLRVQVQCAKVFISIMNAPQSWVISTLDDIPRFVFMLNLKECCYLTKQFRKMLLPGTENVSPSQADSEHANYLTNIYK